MASNRESGAISNTLRSPKAIARLLGGQSYNYTGRFRGSGATVRPCGWGKSLARFREGPST
jgi:hypothetical protein